jgi:lactate dehydrogenase-like 2-hydroxyacid dehydrogenase
MMRIAIIDPQFDRHADIEATEAGPGVEFQILRPGTGSVDAALLRDADAVVNCRSRHVLTAPIVDAMERARIVVQAGVGFNHIDLDACARRGIPVCNTPDYGTMEVADHAMGLTLALLRGIPAYNERLLTRDDAWTTQALPVPPIRRIAGLTFGVVGLGRIGTAAALRARAFQMRIAFYDPYLPPGQELAFGFERAASLAALFQGCDVVSLHCPMTEQTRTMIDATAIAGMKPGAILINTARGGIVDLDAVEAGLRDGRLSGVALDVLPHEPLDRRHPLLTAWTAREPWLEGRLLITPHAAFYTPESLADMRRLSMRAVMSFVREGKLRSCVNLRELARHGFQFDT